MTTKFEFEIEVIVKAAWKGIQVKNIPIRVLYKKNDHVSHFRPVEDFIRISFANSLENIEKAIYRISSI